MGTDHLMMQARLSLCLLGPFQATLDGDMVTAFGSDKSRALLAYLAMNPSVDHRRDALAGLLWPDTSNSDALRNLRTALSLLRDAIHDREVAPPFLSITRRTIQLPQDTGCEVDVWRFRAAIAATKHHNHTEPETCDACAARLQDATALYQDEFLAGFALDSAPFEAWVVSEREALLWQVLEALATVATYHEQQGDYDVVIDCARRQVELAPWREEAHRQWMRALALGGYRNEALRQFEACREILIDELGVEPGAKTVALHEQIRAGTFAPPVVITPPASREPAAPAASLDDGAGPVEPTPRSQSLPRPEPPSLAEPERRLTTVVQAEICGVVALMAQVTSEDWATILSQLLQVLALEVRTYDGEIHRYGDQEVAALFGMGVAHEDDPERAVLAALGMQRAFEAELSRLATEVPEWRPGLVNLDLRAAVHTGEVIATPAVQAIGDSHKTALGAGITETQQLLAQVPAGEVRVSRATHRLVSAQFVWDTSTSGDHTQGIRPRAHDPSAHKGRGIPGMSSPLVGRDAEVQALEGALDQLRSGIGGIVTLVGEAGIGKSRLVAETRDAAGSSIRWVEGRSLSYDGATVYALWNRVIRALLAAAEDDPAAEVGRRLQAYVDDLETASVTSSGGASHAFLTQVLGAPLNGPDRAMVTQMDGPARQDATFAAVVRLVRLTAEQQPLVIVCEDLHWSDPTSLQLLEHVLPLTDHVPLLLICVFRPLRRHGCWRIREVAVRRYPHRHIDLQLYPLSPETGDRLLRNLLTSIPGPAGETVVEQLPQALRETILSLGEGIPFYLEEVLRALIRSRVIVCDTDACEWRAGPDAVDIGIPDTLYGVLRGRVDQLPSGPRHVLQLAAVIGRIFPHWLLADIADRHGLDEHLIVLQREQLIREQARLPERTYIFQHQLTRDATYEGLLERPRRALHRRVAEAMERRYGDGRVGQVGLLAYHWERAGEDARALGYLIEAAEQAQAQYANDEALSYVQRALALTPADDLARTYDLLTRRSIIYDRRGLREEQWADLERLQEIAEGWEEPGEAQQRRLAEVALQKSAYFEHIQDDDSLAEAARSAVVLAQEIGDVDLEIRAESALGTALSDRVDGDDAVYHWERALQLAQRAGYRSQEASILRAIALSPDATSEETSWLYLLKALDIYREIGDRAQQGRVLNALSLLVVHRHQLGSAMAYIEDGLRLCRMTGLRQEEGWGLAQLAWILCDLGVYDQSDQRSREAIARFQEVSDPRGETVATVVRAWVAHQLGDDEASCAYGSRGMRLADAAGTREPSIVARVAVGDAQLGRYNLSAAWDAFREARDRCLELGWSYKVIGPLAGLARVALAQGRLDTALTHVDDVLRRASSDPELRRVFQPIRVYLTCYRVLDAVEDPRADEVLVTAHDLLQRWAEDIADAALRRSFLENVPENRTLSALFVERRRPAL